MCPEQQEASLSAEGELGPPERGGRAERVFTFSTASTDRPSEETIIAFKFGGSSLLGAERMLHSAGLVREAALRSRVCVVVSAMKGVTDRLLAGAEALRDGRATGRPIGSGLRELRIAGTRLSLFYRINQEAERLETLHVAQAEEPWPEEGATRRRPPAA